MTGESKESDPDIRPFEFGHNDLVLAIAYNTYGNRIATSSSDHRIKVFDKQDDNWTLIDTWKGHDAEILDVRHLCLFYQDER